MAVLSSYIMLAVLAMDVYNRAANLAVSATTVGDAAAVLSEALGADYSAPNHLFNSCNSA